MKFQNTNAVSGLSFSVCGKAYAVDAGGEIDIDPAHVPYVIRRGLQLEPAVFKKKPEAKPTPKPAKPAESKPAPAVKPADPVKPSE